MATTVFTAANTLYEPYVLPYIASVLHHNSDAVVEICLEDPQHFMAKNESPLAMIKRYFPERILLRGGEFAGIRGASPRFLETPLLRSKYTYIGDIDFLILDSDITAQHTAHMEMTGLPYSNRLRPIRPNKRRRLSGLHFTLTEAHYPIRLPADWKPLENAEELLYRLIEAKGLPFPAEEDEFRPSHGIHLSIKRVPAGTSLAGPVWQMPDDAADSYSRLWDSDVWQEIYPWFHPAYRMALLILEATLQMGNPDRVIYRAREARALWSELAEGTLIPPAATSNVPTGKDTGVPDATSMIVGEAQGHSESEIRNGVGNGEFLTDAASSFEAASSNGSLPQPVDEDPIGDEPSLIGPTDIQTPSHPGNIKRDTEELAKQALDLTKARRFSEAIALQHELLGLKPDDAVTHDRMSYLMRAVKELDAALEYAVKACELAPSEPEYRRRAARLYEIRGDHERADHFRQEADLIEKQAEIGFWEEQEKTKERYYSRVRDILSQLHNWPRGSLNSPESPDAERLFHNSSIDAVPRWRSYIRPRYQLGDVAHVEGIGNFQITSLTDTHQKRFVRGMPWELPVVALLTELAARCDKESLVFDIGANVGTHTIPMARRFSGDVVAFEPVSENVSVLDRHLALNAIGNVRIIQKACSKEPGKGNMVGYAVEDSGRAKLSVASDGAIEVTTVDHEVKQLNRRLGILKIDVEGHEQGVIEGALSTLRSDRPIVVCELLTSPSCVPQIMSEIGYRAVHLFRSDWVFVPD